MSLKNTTNNYGTIAKSLHWLTALLFLGSYVSVYYREWFTENKAPENWNALQIHLSIGVSIFVISLLRILWRFLDKPPRLEPGPAWQIKAAKIGHLALYIVLIVMPVSGYMGTGVATDWFFQFEIPAFKDTTLFNQFIAPLVSYEAFEEVIDELHKEILGEGLLLVLIGVHVAAALYHHVIKGDRTLRRMTTAG